MKLRLPASLGLIAILVPAAHASPPSNGERALLLVDPGNAESLYVANYYKDARGLPDSHVLYMEPLGPNYVQMADVHLEGFFGTLEDKGIQDQVDFVVVPPGGSFFVSAAGLVSDPCFAVTRFATPTPYTLAFVKNGLKGGGASHSQSNRYATSSWAPEPFSSATAYFGGVPSTSLNAKRYFIGAMLGYTGLRGNTLQEVLDLIDRSVAADGTHPGGTFYFMQTTDAARSGPRHGWYPTAVSQMAGAGGTAAHLMAVLPTGNHDCLGVMTGWASPDIDGGDFTLLPGSFADHLTSFAGRFDTSSQVKMSRWIAKGASGSAGTVEEPCNYAGKFPHARTHVIYRKGATLGEAWFRGMEYRPYQNLLYGDPLTQPWAEDPTVDVPSPPASPASGVVAITPMSAATAAGAQVERVELLVDGVRVQSTAPCETFQLDTTVLADGWHELRVVASDDTQAGFHGSWTGTLEVDNRGASAAASANPTSGDLDQRFDFTVSATGPAALREIRLVQNGRVVAATTTSPDVLEVHGQNLGAGPVRVQAEALFANGDVARSAPVDLAIAYVPGTPAGNAPVAYPFVKRVDPGRAFVLELPASYDDDPSTATYTVVQAPTHSTILSTNTGPFRVVDPPAAPCTDSLTFRVDTPSGTSTVETVTIEYGVPGVRPYGCGVNAPGSLTVVSGAPAVGGSLVLGVDDPTGAQPTGSYAFVIPSAAPHPAFPCGRSLPRSYLTGEMLLDLRQVQPSPPGVPWSGPGTPAEIQLDFPNDCDLIGTRLYVQGALQSPGPRLRLRLTTAYVLEIGH